jgi:FKBP-type peptidyl-prolyl cis-trans isomerase
MKNYLLLILVACLAFSCDTYDPEKQLEEDIADIKAYLAEKGITNAIQTESGLFYVIDDEGSGTEHPTISSTVNCDYVGFLLDEEGTIFDAGTGVEFRLTNVIKGWQEGIPKLKRDGTGRFYVPSTLAYGNQRQGQIIGRNEILGFEVTLNNFW